MDRRLGGGDGRGGEGEDRSVWGAPPSPCAWPARVWRLLVLPVPRCADDTVVASATVVVCSASAENFVCPRYKCQLDPKKAPELPRDPVLNKVLRVIHQVVRDTPHYAVKAGGHTDDPEASGAHAWRWLCPGGELVGWLGWVVGAGWVVRCFAARKGGRWWTCGPL